MGEKKTVTIPLKEYEKMKEKLEDYERKLEDLDDELRRIFNWDITWK